MGSDPEPQPAINELEALRAEVARWRQREIVYRHAEQELQRRRRWFDEQNRALDELTRSGAVLCGDLDTALEEILAVASRRLGVVRASLWIYEEVRRRLRCRKLYDRARAEFTSGALLDFDSCPAYFAALARNRTIAVSDAQSDPRTSELTREYLSPLGVRALLDAPVRVFGRVVGVVCHEHIGSTRAWSPEEEAFAATLADFVAVALEAQEVRARERLIEGSEAKYRYLVESLPAAIYSFDPVTKRVAYVSPQIEDMTGYPPESWVDESDLLRRVLEPADLEHLRGRLREAFSTGLPSVAEYRVHHRDGRERWLRDAFRVIRAPDGTPFVLQGVVQDVTALKAAERASQEWERRFHALLADPDHLGLILSFDGQISFVNRAVETTTGWPADALVGANWFDRLVPPGDRERVRAAFRDAVARGFVVPQFDNAIVTRSGETRHVHWTNTILKDPDGRFTAVAAVGVDVTERLRLQEQLHDTLRMESLGRLASAVAHDFNNLLTAVFGSVQLARMAESSREVTEQLDLIQDTASRAAELTSQLLSFARKRPIRPQTVEFNRVLTECERMVRRMVTDPTRIEASFASDAGFAYLDPGQLQQVFVNLVVNARDAMPLGGTVTIESRHVSIPGDAPWEHDGVPNGDWVVLSVRDEGAGIDPAVRERLFEPFFTTKAPGKGTGLGLATCYGIVSAAGGHILVDTAPARGTTFRVYFPRRSEATAAAAEASSWRTPPPGSARVLIVESDPVVRELTREILASNGYSAAAAATSDEALRLVTEDGGFDLLIIELLMPLVDGATLARRARSRHPQIKVILTSGYVTESGEPGLAAGAGATFLAKPFTPEQLLWTMDAVMAEKNKEDVAGRRSEVGSGKSEVGN